MTEEEFKKMFPTTPNYTLEMYEGNIPASKGHNMVDGGIADEWKCKYGGGETYNGELIHAEFHINKKITIVIIGDHLWITDFRYSNKTDIWEYTNDNVLRFPSSPCLAECHRHKLEDEKIQDILTKNTNCLFGEIVRKKVLNLYEWENN